MGWWTLKLDSAYQFGGRGDIHECVLPTLQTTAKYIINPDLFKV